MNSIIQYLHTIRYLKLNQILGRLIWILKNNIFKPYITWRTTQIVSNIAIPSIKKLDLSPKPALPSAGYQQPSHNYFKFLNQEVNFPSGIEWNSGNLEKLWLYNLHYFDYLIPLTHNISTDNYKLGKRIIKDWISNNSVGKGVGWKPYPLSLRIVNWIFFYYAYYEQFQNDTDFNKHYLLSLFQQSYYLNWFIEYHILANHLFENIKTLLIAGLFFQNIKYLKKSVRLLRKELNEQILPDGGHYERSPMYHMIILLGCLDIWNLLKKDRETNGGAENITESMNLFSVHLKAKITKMTSWLEHMCHPDGEIPLFGDSAFNVAPDRLSLKKYFQAIDNINYERELKRKMVALSSSGYYIFHCSSQYLVVDGGPLGVDYQPGHAHCDFLSFEYSYDNQRFIVDSGLGEYRPSELRKKARGIYSHNTVVVNKLEQADIWKAFRVGRRIKPGEVEFNEDNVNNIFNGKYFNSLKKDLSYTHQRKILLIEQKFFVVQDRVHGKHILTVENLIHIHPECKIILNSDEITLKQNAMQIYILYNSRDMKIELTEWFYVPEFGNVKTSSMIIFKPQIEKSINMYYVITPLIHREEARVYLDGLIQFKKE
jgi:uncharacterized heparinase superfamily protein